MTKAVPGRALDVEIADHLGHDVGDPAGGDNSRSGHGRKTVLTTAGPVEREVPRDRNGTFTPLIVPKRRLGNVEEAILSLYAPGHVDPRHRRPPGRGLRRCGSTGPHRRAR
jgi:putative transposase